MVTSDYIPEVCLKISALQLSADVLYFFSFLSLSHLAFQGMKNEILIPMSVVPKAYYLGPMGDADPLDFIKQETNQIPFRQSLVDLSSWNTKNPFSNWPKMPKGWRDWFHRVSYKKGED